MLNAVLSKAFCVNINMHVFGFPLFLLFILWLFPLPPSLGHRLPSRTAALQSVAGEVLGRASTLALLDYSEVIGRPASRLF